MSTLEKKLYKEITVKGNTRPDYGIGEKTYKGFSTVNPDNIGFQLYDLQLVKQDIINHFHIRQGELLSNPNFGTIIWDILYEPQETKQQPRLLYRSEQYHRMMMLR